MVGKSKVLGQGASAKEARCEVTVPCQIGLTLHVSARLMEAARRFESEITIANEKLVADAKSILSMLMLGAARGQSLLLVARGNDASEAVGKLSDLFKSKDDLCKEDFRGE